MSIFKKKENKTIIAVLSGKGGTGKTLVSVNLACVIPGAVYADCDVEEPNGHLFFKPINLKTKEIGILIPSINEEKCTGCTKCVEFCKFNALAYVGRVMVFEEICHYCGGCTIVCPEKAITEVNLNIGKVVIGDSEGTRIISGFLNVGSVSGVPIIKDIQKQIKEEEHTVIVDCPPGSACAVMESVQSSDYCILVAEPTIFGSHNLDMVYKLVTLFKKPCGVILNKCDGNENPSKEYCIRNNIEIIAEIPYDSELSDINGNGEIAARVSQKYKDIFMNIAEKIPKVK
ncbi:MAG: ATP-binding protein [Clostridia bacterium]|nr:ATP-binding protein [Clostridia bacterium]